MRLPDETPVISGVGAVSGAGIGVAALLAVLREGGSSLRPPVGAGIPEGRGTVGQATLSGDAPLGRCQEMAERAVDEALADAGWGTSERIGLFLGTAHGPLDVWEENMRPGVCDKELWRPSAPWRLTDRLAERFDAPPVFKRTVTVACVSSTLALMMADDALRRSRCDRAVVVGVESLTRFIWEGFSTLKALSAGRCRPFDKQRDGLSLGEGGAALALERLGDARRSDRRPYAALLGGGTSADAYHLTAPDPNGKGMATAMKGALSRLPGRCGAVDYLNAHGTGTLHNDRMEMRAFKRFFGGVAARTPVSSTKSVTGHASGAAGAMEALVCALTIRHRFLPSTFGLTEPETPVCDFLRGAARSVAPKTVVSVNAAFGGVNAAIAMGAL